MIHPLFWILFGGAGKLPGIRDRFFSTKMRSLATSEVIGLIGTIASLVLAPEHTFSLIITAVGVNVLMIVLVLLYLRVPFRATRED